MTTRGLMGRGARIIAATITCSVLVAATAAAQSVPLPTPAPKSKAGSPAAATNADRVQGAGPALPIRKVIFPNARMVRHVKWVGSQSGMSSGLLTTTPNRSPIAARLAACSAAAGTGTPSGPGSCLVAVALATTVGW